MKNFDDFCAQCAEKGMANKIAESVEGLTEQQATGAFRIFLQILREYHEWNQKESER